MAAANSAALKKYSSSCVVCLAGDCVSTTRLGVAETVTCQPLSAVSLVCVVSLVVEEKPAPLVADGECSGWKSRVEKSWPCTWQARQNFVKSKTDAMSQQSSTCPYAPHREHGIYSTRRKADEKGAREKDKSERVEREKEKDKAESERAAEEEVNDRASWNDIKSKVGPVEIRGHCGSNWPLCAGTNDKS